MAEKKTPKLHELLAVEGDAAKVYGKVIEEASTTFSKKQDHFWGQVKAITFFDEARAGENTQDSKPMVTTVREKLEYVAGHGARYLDIIAQKEATNQTAKADVVIDGNVLIADVPVTHLLTLETKLKELRQVYDSIPTLDPSVSWVEDPNSAKGVYKSQTAAVTFRTEKKLMHKVLVDATDKHPAQIEKWSEDKPVARIETNKTSGMLSSADKSVLLARIDRLAEAVKRARQRANGAPIVEIKVGKAIFDYLHGGF